ncbi:fluoride efflux transporter CrcB [Leptospira sp. WS92.C1]
MSFERTLLWIGFGGAIGSVFRYLLQYWFGNTLEFTLPWGTLIVNFLGSFVIGVVYALSEKFPGFDPNWKFFIASGFCGGFTTFSTFSYESFQMLKTGNYILFFGYAGLSVFGGIGLVFCGAWLVKNF